MDKTKVTKESLELELKANFQTFKDLVMTQDLNAVFLVKDWLRIGGKKALARLQGLAQQVSATDLDFLILKLTPIERERWRIAIEKQLSGQELFEANKSIAEEVKKIKVSPFMIKDIELFDLMMGLDLEQAKEFLNTNGALSGIFLNFMPADFVSELLENLAPERAQALIEKSLLYESTNSQSEMITLKSALLEYLKDNKKVPFGDLLTQIVVTFSPQKERLIYKVMLKQGLIKEFKETALKHFPSDLVEKLPAEFIQKVMSDYPLPKKIELLASLSEEERERYLKKFADKGSAARDMIDLELENILKNEQVLEKYLSQKELIWSAFVGHVRKLLQKEDEIQSELAGLIDEWRRELL